MTDSSPISPTAHYTGRVWLRNGLSHPALGTWQGAAMFTALQPVMVASGALGGPSLEAYLLARHRAIDGLLEHAISTGRITQIVEIACGLSPRGWRFAGRHGAAITYVEADLPGMAGRKRDALARIGALNAHHRVETIDALREGGPDSLENLAAALDQAAGVAVVTEGLLGYLDTNTVEALWRRIAAVLARFPAGLYVSDILPESAGSNPAVVAGRRALGVFVGGRAHLHYADAGAVCDAARSAGFAEVRVRPAAEIQSAAGGVGSLTLAQVIEARAEPSRSRARAREDP
jgi:O-methyltransferase involved in polyketide biosynthesis